MDSTESEPSASADDSSQGRRPEAKRASTSPALGTLARDGLLALSSLVVSALLQLVLVLVVARGLGTAGTGLFFAAVALFTILSNAGELGADTGLVRVLPRYRALGRISDLRPVVIAAAVPVLAAGVSLSALVWMFAPDLAALFTHGRGMNQVADYTRDLALFLPLASASTVALAGIRGFGTMVPYVWIQNIALPALRPTLIFLAVSMGLGGSALVLGWGLPFVPAFLAGVVLLMRFVRRAEMMAGAVRVPRSSMRGIAVEFWRFSAPRGLAAILGITVTWLDILLVSALRTPGEAGVYASVSRLSIAGAYALNAVGMAIAPQISEFVARQQAKEAEAVFQIATWWLMGLTWPIYLMMGIFPMVVLSVFGQDFTNGSSALTILCVAQLVNIGTGNATVVLLMAGKSSWSMINAVASLAFDVGLNLLLIPRIGITGAAIAWAVSIVCINLAALVEVRFLLGIRLFGRGYFIVAFGALVAFLGPGLAMRATVGTSGSSFGAFAAVGVIGYAAWIWRFRDALELRALRGVMPKFRHSRAMRPKAR